MILFSKKQNAIIKRGLGLRYLKQDALNNREYDEE